MDYDQAAVQEVVRAWVGPHRLGGWESVRWPSNLIADASAQPTIAGAGDHGNPDAQPPILRSATPSELAVITQLEARKVTASAYVPPAPAEYSLAELNAYKHASH